MAGYQYFMHYPNGYDAEEGRRWALIITLHGAGERHVPLETLQRHHYYLPMYELTSAQYPALVVVPQCPPRAYWEPGKL